MRQINSKKGGRTNTSNGTYQTSRDQTDKKKLSRKQQRKTMRIQKKERMKNFTNKKPHTFSNQKSQKGVSKSIQQPVKMNKSNQKHQNKSQQSKQIHKRIEKIDKKKILQKSKKQPSKTDLQLLEEQKQIEYYQKKLGIRKQGKSKGKYKGVAKGLGYDDDLFDFLDNIGKKVTGNMDDEYNYQQNSQEQQNSYGEEQDQDQDQNQQYQESQQQGENEYDQYLQQMQSEGDQLNQIQQQSQMIGEGESSEENQGEEEYQQQQDLDHYGGIEDRQDLAWAADYLQQDNDQNGQYISSLEECDIDPDAQQQQMNNEISKKHNQNKLKQQQIKQKKQKTEKEIKKTSKQITNQSTERPSQRPSLFKATTKEQKQSIEIRKQFNSFFNKLSDGNLLMTFRQCSQVFQTYSKAQTIPMFIKIFIKFNIEVEKPHLHILLSNIALACGLHQLLGNRLMAPLVYEIVKKFISLQKQPQDQEQINEIGYSRLFQKKKNCISILSYLYEFGSLIGDFIKALIISLSEELNKDHIEFIYMIIQKIGVRIRQNDPGVLKLIIDNIKESINAFKAQRKELAQSESGNQQKTKIDIIQIQLNELKFNRVKDPTFKDQRLAFLNTFLTKNIPKEVGSSQEKQILLLDYQQVKNANIERTNWWEDTNQDLALEGNGVDNDQQFQMVNQLTAEKKQLLQLAKTLHLVTQIRKNIFVEIMQSSDYVEATQRVLALRIKNQQEIATVLIQVCAMEPTFNPFYPLVAAKVANLQPKFRMSVQFALWDHLKLLETYQTRKTSNLAKFAARFISNPLSNASLSMLKFFPDLINIPPTSSLFLMIFFREFLSIAKKQSLVSIGHKLKEDNNKIIKQSILEYLNEVGIRQKGFGNIQKMKFLRKLLSITDQQQ